MNKYLLLSLCLAACDPKPPQGWDRGAAAQWAHADHLHPISVVCQYADTVIKDEATCTIKTDTQIVNVWCFYRATPYCLPEYR